MVGPALRLEFPTDWFDDQTTLIFDEYREMKNVGLPSNCLTTVTVPPTEIPEKSSMSFLQEEFYKRLSLFIFRCDTRCWNFNKIYPLPSANLARNKHLLRPAPPPPKKKGVFPGLQHTSTFRKSPTKFIKRC